jgi:uncharacterized membrane protein YbhN (UPF0104 family)
MSRVVAWVKGSLKYVVGFGLLAWVVAVNWATPPGSAAPGLGDLVRARVDPLALAGAGLLLTGAIVVQVLRWHVLVRALGVPLPFRDALRVGLVAVFYNTFLPGAVGGDLVRAYVVARDCPGRRAAAVASVGIDRVIGLFGLILYTALVGGGCWLTGDPRILGNPSLQTAVGWSAVAAIAGLGGWAALGLIREPAAERMRGLLARVPKVGPPLAGLWRATWLYRRRRRAVALALMLTAVAQGGLVGGFDLAARTFPPSDPAGVGTLAEHFVIVPLGFVAQAVIPSPGGVGAGEAAYGWLYREVLGKPAATGIAASLGVRFLFAAIGLVGYVVYLRERTRLPGPDKAEPAGTTPRPGARRLWPTLGVAVSGRRRST